jgi:hypothetical protein
MPLNMTNICDGAPADADKRPIIKLITALRSLAQPSTNAPQGASQPLPEGFEWDFRYEPMCAIWRSSLTNWSPETEADETTALLIRARGFLERGWCRFDFAYDAAGQSVHPKSRHAVAWCVNGALIAAGVPSWLDNPDSRSYDDHPAVRRLEAAMGGWMGIGGFNNRQETVEPILAAFDRAIAAGSR